MLNNRNLVLENKMLVVGHGRKEREIMQNNPSKNVYLICITNNFITLN
jgi:hypothetical protein